MASVFLPSHETSARAAAPGRATTVVGWLVAVWCVGFATANLVFELTDHFAHGPLSAYAPAISVMNWIVFCLKLLGGAVALLAVARLPRSVSPNPIAFLLWGAAALLTIYSLGNVVEAIGMASGLTGSPEQITPRDVGYVLFFPLGAAGYVVLSRSFSRRYDVSRRAAVLGAAGAPVLLALILLVIPALLVATGLMPG